MPKPKQKPPPRLPRLPLPQRAMAVFAAVHNGDAVLELPCGGGVLMDALRQSGLRDLRHAGACFDPETTRAMRETLPGSDLMYALPEELPWPSMSFDVVMGVLDKTLSASATPLLVEMLRVLKPGGQCVLAVPTLPGPLRAMRGQEERELSAPTDIQMKKRLIWAGFRRAACYRYSPFWLVTVGFGSEKAMFL